MALRKPHQMFYLQIPLGLLVAVWVLYVAKVIVVPLVIAILLAFVLTPIVINIQRRGIGRVYAVIITVFLTFAMIGGAGWIVGSQIHSLAGELPNHRKEIDAKIASLRDGSGVIGNIFQMFREIGKDEPKSKTAKEGDSTTKEKDVIVVRPAEPSSAELVFQTAAPILEPLANACFVVILVIFILINREDLRNRFISLLGQGRLSGTTWVIVDSAERVSGFLLTQLLVNLAFGVLFGIGLLLIGVEYAVLWAFLTALLRFVPYIGTWISATLPLALSIATAPTWTQPVILLVYFGILDLLTANFVEPLLIGHQTGVTPIALLVAAAFWTWLWGPIGLVLSTPLTVCLVVLGQHVPRFRFFALLLGDQPPLEPIERYYQRLLARDQDEAKEVALEYAQAKGIANVYDDVLLPTLALARRDRRDGGLDVEDEEFVFSSTRDILISLDVSPPPIKDGPSPAPDEQSDVPPGSSVRDEREGTMPAHRRILIFGCPAHHAAEELSLQMLARLLKPDGCDVRVISTKALPREIQRHVEQENPALVFIGILPPGGLAQASYLCKLLRNRFPDLSIVVGYWGAVRNFNKLLMQIHAAGGDYVTTSLRQARSQIGALIQSGPDGEPPAGARDYQEDRK